MSSALLNALNTERSEHFEHFAQVKHRILAASTHNFMFQLSAARRPVCVWGAPAAEMVVVAPFLSLWLALRGGHAPAYIRIHAREHV